MRNLLLFAIIAVFIASCGSGTKENAVQEETAKIYSLEELFSNADSLIGQEIQIKGQVDHVCVHGGQRLILACKHSEESIKVVVADTTEFLSDTLNGQTIIVIGVVKESQLDTNYINEWEASLLAEKAEKDSLIALEKANRTDATEEEFKELDAETEEHHEHAEGEEHQGVHQDCTSGLGQIEEMRQYIKDNNKAYYPIYYIEKISIEIMNEGKHKGEGHEVHNH